MSRVAVIVDAYSSGRLLAPEFIRRGFRCIHVQSSLAPPIRMYRSFVRGDFVDNLVYGPLDFEGLVALLSKVSVEVVVPGCDTGVLLADRLANRLNVAANTIGLSLARRNKWEMQLAASAAGLRVPQQIISRNLESVVNWRKQEGLSGVVLKPTCSAGSDNVWICSGTERQTDDKIQLAFRAILDRVNAVGLENKEVLVQEFIEGTEFVVNTVSAGGIHHVVLMWEYRKVRTEQGVVYDCDLLCGASKPHFGALADYVFKLLDSLEIGYGPCHTELMVDSRGVVLIEMAARMDGVICQELDDICVGYSQVDLTVDCYLDPSALTRKTAAGYGTKREAMIVHLICDQEGVVAGTPGLRDIEKLPSFFDCELRVSKGDVLRKTMDLTTSPGRVFLSGDSLDALERDRGFIRALEAVGGVFSLAAS